MYDDKIVNFDLKKSYIQLVHHMSSQLQFVSIFEFEPHSYRTRENMVHRYEIWGEFSKISLNVILI